MAAKSYAEAKQLLLSEIEKMWLKKPRDVENLSNVLGAFKQSGSVKIYADDETSSLNDALTRLRAIHERGDVSTPAMSNLSPAASLPPTPNNGRGTTASRTRRRSSDEIAGCLRTPPARRGWGVG